MKYLKLFEGYIVDIQRQLDDLEENYINTKVGELEQYTQTLIDKYDMEYSGRDFSKQYFRFIIKGSLSDELIRDLKSTNNKVSEIGLKLRLEQPKPSGSKFPVVTTFAKVDDLVSSDAVEEIYVYFFDEEARQARD